MMFGWMNQLQVAIAVLDQLDLDLTFQVDEWQLVHLLFSLALLG